jgi:hypothetical protein
VPHPGSVSRQYQVCGNPACRCLHPTKPQKHGPYYKPAYVHRGKQVCRFVRAGCVEEMKARLAAYKKFRSLMDKWIELSIRQGVIDFFGQRQKAGPEGPHNQRQQCPQGQTHPPYGSGMSLLLTNHD